MPNVTAEISDAFRTMYRPNLIIQYQLMGSQLRKYMMGPSEINAENVKFDVISKIEAVSKARGEKITYSQPKHGHVFADLETRYALSRIDRQDMARLDKPDIMMKYAMQGASAVGRAQDSIILNDGFAAAATDSASTKVSSLTGATQGLTLEKAVAGVEALSRNDVGYGQIYAVVGPAQWSDLMKLEQFANADWAEKGVWMSGMPEAPRNFRGATWFCYNGLPVSATNVATCYVWDKAALGYADSDGMWFETDYEIDEDSFKILHGMDVASCAIQPAGVSVIYAKQAAIADYADLL